jgi:FkbM family methyltransferase
MSEVRKYFANGGDASNLYNYNLDLDSIILDIGGHTGDLGGEMYNRFGCNVNIFEPIKDFYDNIVQRFASIEKIRVFNYGVGKSNYETLLNVQGESTSEFPRNDKIIFGKKELVQIKSFVSVIRELDLNMIEVCSINIEGGEYNLIPHIINEGAISQIKNLQIQFHDFIPNAEQMRKEIQDKLSETHKMTFNYDFVWENWEKK